MVIVIVKVHTTKRPLTCTITKLEDRKCQLNNRALLASLIICVIMSLSPRPLVLHKALIDHAALAEHEQSGLDPLKHYCMEILVHCSNHLSAQTGSCAHWQ